MRTFTALVVLLPLLARAEEPAPPVGAESSTQYWTTCRHIWARSPYVVARLDVPYLSGGTLPVPSSGGSGSGTSGGGSLSGLGSGSGAGAGYAILALAVVAIAALPFIVYAVDEDADPLTLDRFYCPELNFSAVAGVQLGGGPGAAPVSGLGVAKLRLDLGYVGAQAEVGMSPPYGGPAGLGGFAAHFLLRPVPKAHLEGALAIGGRRAPGPGGTLDGLELALPHTYVFKRDGYRKYGLELTPRGFWNRSGIDVGVDALGVVPLADVLTARFGFGVFSHARAVQFTASAGLTAGF